MHRNEECRKLNSQEDADSIVDLLARGKSVKRDLLQRAGDALDAADVAQFLGISSDAVDELRQAKRLLAVQWEEVFVYPQCQFDKTHGVVPGLHELLTVLLQDGGGEWTALGFLLVSLEELNGYTPLEVLQHGDDPLHSRMLRQARIAAGEGFG